MPLKEKVRAAVDEFDQAIAYHEAWKPAAYDTSLHGRMGTSFATNTFWVIRQALRREMLMSLIRLWDEGQKERAISLPNIANILDDCRIMNVLAAKCEAQWGTQPVSGPVGETEDVRAAVQRSEAAFGQERSKKLRQQATCAIALIRRYEKGGAKHETLKYLHQLRNQHLAHRQRKPDSLGSASSDSTDEAIEAFYQDMAKVIHRLCAVVENSDYQPTDSAENHSKFAALFWAGVHGERTEGHPAYKVSP